MEISPWFGQITEEETLLNYSGKLPNVDEHKIDDLFASRPPDIMDELGNDSACC